MFRPKSAISMIPWDDSGSFSFLAVCTCWYLYFSVICFHALNLSSICKKGKHEVPKSASLVVISMMQLTVCATLLTVDVATTEHKSVHSKPSSMCRKVRTRCRNPPRRRFLVGCRSSFMRFTKHLTALRAWCTRWFPAW